MTTTGSLFEGVSVVFTIITLAFLLRRFGLFKKEDSLIFSKAVIKITLPALIFSSLALSTFKPEFLNLAVIMAIVEVAILILAYLIAKMLKFNKGKTGALMLVSAFGMSSMLGYPLIRQVFPGSAIAVEEAVVTSEFGVGFLLFIVAPLIAMYFGDGEVKGKNLLKTAAKFFVSPIFVSLVLGILVSFININQENTITKTAIRLFDLVGNANTLLVCFTVGLIVEFKRIEKVFGFLALAVLLKLIIKPLLAYILTSNGVFTVMMDEVVLIETALPSAILVSVFAKQYNCRADLVSLSIMTTLLISLASISLLFVLLF